MQKSGGDGFEYDKDRLVDLTVPKSHIWYYVVPQNVGRGHVSLVGAVVIQCHSGLV